MRDQDDAPYVVIERDSGGGLGSFVLGALVGAGLALLFAPKSGAETQEDLKEHARRFRGAAEEHVREAQRQVEERLEEVREGVQTGFNGVKDAVNAGRSAASEARTDLEDKLQRSKAAYHAGVRAAQETVSIETEEEPEAEAL